MPWVGSLAESFPEPAALRPQVEFWVKVYVDVTTEAGLVHDTKYLDVIYEQVRFGRDQSWASQQKTIDQRKRHWRGALKRLAAGSAPRGRDERRAVAALGKVLGRAPSQRDFARAAGRIRFQRGQSDKFRAGVIRAGAYEPEFRRIFAAHGVPADLVYLPHVESSFQAHARSKYGAAGMWQFMPATGRRYLDIDTVQDERMDPERAAVAAARLLRDNYAKLRTWPLALSAYNHGAAGIARAVRKLGTRDIVTILQRYRSRSFRFASRNFYPQFLAARRVASQYETYFGPLTRDRPAGAESVTLPFYVDAETLAVHAGLATRELAALNPALRDAVLRSDKRIPKGYALRLPAGTLAAGAQSWLATIPPALRHSRQRRSAVHVVTAGETLSGIARRHDTSVATIVALNRLGNAHRIYVGQRLELSAPRTTIALKPKSDRSLSSTSAAVTAPSPVSRPESALSPTPAFKPETNLAERTPTPVVKPGTRLAGVPVLASLPMPMFKPALRLAERTPTPAAKPDVRLARVAPAPLVPRPVSKPGTMLAALTPTPRVKPAEGSTELAAIPVLKPGTRLALATMVPFLATPALETEGLRPVGPSAARLPTPVSKPGRGGALALALPGAAAPVPRPGRRPVSPALTHLLAAPDRKPESSIASAAASPLQWSIVLEAIASSPDRALPGGQARDSIAITQSFHPVPPSPSRESVWRRIEGDSVVVDSDETLGHFADWLRVSTHRLRKLNRLSATRSIRMGQRLELDFSKTPRLQFLERRIAHHQAREKDFFAVFKITGTVEHTLRPGENLWVLSNKVYSVPAWLIHRYNPDADLTRLTPGTRFKIPVVEPISSS